MVCETGADGPSFRAGRLLFRCRTLRIVKGADFDVTIANLSSPPSTSPQSGLCSIIALRTKRTQAPSPCLPPLNFLSLVTMNFSLTTGAEHGGEQLRRQHSSANPTSSKSPCSARSSVSLGMPQMKNPADHPLRRGAACCARSSASDQRHSLDVHFSGSNRNWPKNRSRRKQTIKPCLTGTRIAQCRARFSFAKPQSHNCRSLATSHSRLATVVSNRELLVLEIPQLIENTRRQPLLIENFEPNSAPVFPSFVAAAFLPRGTMGRRAGFPLLEIPPNRSTGQGAA